MMLGLLAAHSVLAEPVQVDSHRWENVERIVAVGDLHGDYTRYIEVLRIAGLIDRRARWSGGSAHLVQTGDIPDRGPDTRRIIEHMAGLARQARRSGGRVHNLMGNHEAMNVYGDLRYVTGGEFQAFVTRRSEDLRLRYFEAMLDDLRAREPERFETLPDDFRDRWFAQHPPGWIEHRMAWDPDWNEDGEMFQWVLETQVAIQINNLIFLHAGISGSYCRDSLESMTERAHEALRRGDRDDLGILTDEYGPLWYRGLAGVAPEAAPETVEAILERHSARHIVIGHTPTGGFIRPRFDGRVIQIDTGIGAAYGGNVAYLEITADGPVAGYRDGKVALPADDDGLIDYLDQVLLQIPGNVAAGELRRRLAEAAGESAPTQTPTDGSEVPICGTSL